jgi:hypothetical protein
MQKTIRVVVAAMAALFTVQAQAAPVDVKGRWKITLAPMVAQAKTMKIAPKAIEQMENLFRDGLMVLDEKKMALSIDGAGRPPVVYKYRVVSSKDNCVSVVVEQMPQGMRLCVKEKTMYVHDPKTELILVYRRL